MPFTPIQAPPNMDTDGLRQHGEDQHREIERAWTELEGTIDEVAAGLDGKVGTTGDWSMSGKLTITNATPATAYNTGALQVTGGVGIGGRLWVNEGMYSSGPQAAIGFDDRTGFGTGHYWYMYADSNILRFMSAIGPANRLTIDDTSGLVTVPGSLTVISSPVYGNIPQVVMTAADYIVVASDAGKHILHPGTDTNPRKATLPNDATVNFPLGTVITFVNKTNVLTISIGAGGTLVLGGQAVTGDRALAANGVATAIKVLANEWIVSGAGLT